MPFKQDLNPRKCHFQHKMESYKNVIVHVLVQNAMFADFFLLIPLKQ